MFTKAHSTNQPSLVHIRKLLSRMERFKYDSSWQEKYRTRSPGTIDRTEADSIMCLEAALYFAANVEAIAEETQLLAIHRADSEKRECGHCICVFKVEGLYGAYSHSNITSLKSLEPEYSSIGSIIEFYINSYIQSGYKPLYYGLYQLSDLDEQGGTDWRDTDKDLSIFSKHIIENYQFELDVSI